MNRMRMLWLLAAAALAAACASPGAREDRQDAPGGQERTAGAAIRRAEKPREAGAPEEPENPRRALEQRRRSRLDEHGRIPANALLDAKRIAKGMPQLLPAAGSAPGEIVPEDAGIDSWNWLGPSNVGGRARALVIDPTTPGRMFLGAANGGIWKTTNGGASWVPLDDFLPSLAVQALAMDPDDPNVLYAGTGQGHRGTDGVPGAGIFKTTDGGDTWTQLPATAPPPGPIDPTDPTQYPWNYVYALAVDPLFPERVLAAVSTGIYLSLNGGTSWNFVYDTDTGGDAQPDHRVTDLRFRPGSSQLAIAGLDNGGILFTSNRGLAWFPADMLGALYTTLVTSPYPTPTTVLFVSDTAGFAVDDLIEVGIGLTWDKTKVTKVVSSTMLEVKEMPNSHPVGHSARLLRGGRVSLAWGSGGVAYASMDAGGGAIFKSEDNGASWLLLDTTDDTADYLCANFQGVTDRNSCLGWHANSIWVDPTDNEFIVVGGVDLWRDPDVALGLNLERVSNWFTYHTGQSAHADQHVILEHPGYDGANNKTVFVANDGGVQVAGDIKSFGLGDAGWANLANGLGITQFYAGAASPTGSFMVGGAQDNGMLQLDDVGNEDGWTQCLLCTGDGGPSAIDPRSPNQVFYQTTQNLKVWKTVVGGSVYFEATNGLADTGSEDVRFIAPFMMDPNDADILVAGGVSIWRSTNGADTWVPIRPPRAGNSPCSALAVAEGNSQAIWAGYENGALSRTDGGVMIWIDLDDGSLGNNPLPNAVITDIAINPFDNRDVFVSVGGYATNRLWYTSDTGANWQSRHNNLPPVQINTVTFHPDNENWVYVGTDLGVYASEDKGQTWSLTPSTGTHDGPVNTEVADLFWHGDNLVAATYGRGMYRTRPFVTVFVDEANTGLADGSEVNPFPLVITAVNLAGPGTTISIAPGDYDESGPITFSTRGQVIAPQGGVTIH